MFHRGGRGFGFGGFTISKGSSSSSGSSNPGLGRGMGSEGQMGGMNVLGMAGRSYGHLSNIGKRRMVSEEEYFEDDDDGGELEYQPAPGSPTHKANNKSDSDSGSEDDPLDAYMAGIEKEIEHQEVKEVPKKSKKGVRDDIEEEDVQEAYFRYMEENPMAGLLGDEDDMNMEYDEDGNVIVPNVKKIIDPLPPIDHDEIDYAPFVKNFYDEHEEIKILTPPQVQELHRKLGVRVSGFNPSKPVSSFAHLGFDDALMKAIRKAEYTQPTPIQAQGVPVALSGRDIIGIAKTGSGKTAAYLWPLLVHIMDQPELKVGDGPIGLILAPTRELAQQIYHEAKKFGKVYNIKVVCAYGGGSLYEQSKACEEGAEIIVATPGRLIDLVKKKATNLQRVTYLVFDEADRMFDMGFEPQVRSIANHIRPDRQTLLFSATFKRKVERLARDVLADPIRVIQGELGEANEDITQIVEVFDEGPAKWAWLRRRLVQFTTVGSVLIFVTRKANSEELANNLQSHDFKLVHIHGDMDQTTRNEVITKFKKKEVPVMVATDVAARGLDIPSIRTVVNYDVARDIDTHTHRIGRTGRAGEKGTAYTLVTNKDKEFCPHLVRNLESSNQFVPQTLVQLALQCTWFKKSRSRDNKAKKLNLSGRGLGQRERPGLGSGTGGGGGQHSALSSYHHGKVPGPQSDRVSSMKQAFSSQFKSNFVAATEAPSSTEYTNPQSVDEMAAQVKRRKKSRWE